MLFSLKHKEKQNYVANIIKNSNYSIHNAQFIDGALRSYVTPLTF